MKLTPKYQPGGLLALIQAAMAEAEEIGADAEALRAKISAMSDEEVKAFLYVRGLSFDRTAFLQSLRDRVAAKGKRELDGALGALERALGQSSIATHHESAENRIYASKALGLATPPMPGAHIKSIEIRIGASSNRGSAVPEITALSSTSPPSLYKSCRAAQGEIHFLDDGRVEYVAFEAGVVPITLWLGTKSYTLKRAEKWPDFFEIEELSVREAIRFLKQHAELVELPVSWT